MLILLDLVGGDDELGLAGTRTNGTLATGEGGVELGAGGALLIGPKGGSSNLRTFLG